MASGEVLVFDLEATGLLREADKIHCIAAINYETREEYFYGPGDITDGLLHLATAACIIGHNAVGYDIPLIKKLYPEWVCPPFEDTLILSRLYNSDRGAHSVDAWGQRFGMKKPLHEDWSKYTEDMGHRCREDTRITCRILRALQVEGGTHDWEAAAEIEYIVQLVQSLQELRGTGFRKDKAQGYYDKWKKEFDEIEDTLTKLLPHTVTHGTTYAAPFKKDGGLKANVLKRYERGEVGGPFSFVTFTPPNLGSPKQVKDFLLSHGWEATEFNYKKAKGGGYELEPDGSYVIASPKLTEDSFDSINIEGNIGQLIKSWGILRHRLGILYRVRKKDGQVAGWLGEVRDDGRLEARAIPQGTNTGRYRHSVIVNVPSVHSSKGKELRSCLTPTPGHVLIGVDAAQLEAREEASYTFPYDEGKHASVILEGDIHTVRAEAYSEAAGREISRDEGKSPTYAISYGAGARKLASTMKVPVHIASAIIGAFWDSSPALQKLMADLKKEFNNKGYLTGIDGRKLLVRSAHSALNLMFQSAGSITVKYAIRNAMFYSQTTGPTLEDRVNQYLDKFYKGELKYWILLSMHDEVLVETLPEHAEEFIEVALQAFIDAGEELKHNVPIIGDAKVGFNYADVH